MLLPLLLLQSAAAPGNPYATAPAAYKKASAEWKACTERVAHKYAVVTSEPAASVVDAAIGECTEDFDKARAAVMGTLRRRDSEYLMRSLINEWRPQLMASVFRLRVNQPKKGK
jgi:hypothetical protein